MIKQLRAIACGALSIIVLATALIPLDTSYAYVSDKFDGYEEGREYNTSELYDIKFRTSKLGLYGMTIESHEIPSNEWLTFISHDYFPYTTLSDQTEVDNTAPSAVYSAKGIVKVDVVVAIGEFSESSAIKDYIPTFSSKLNSAGNAIDAHVQELESAFNSEFALHTTWDTVSDMDTHIRLYNSRGQQIEYIWYGHKQGTALTLDKDDVKGANSRYQNYTQPAGTMDGEWFTIDFPNLPADAARMDISIVAYGGTATTTISLVDKLSDTLVTQSTVSLTRVKQEIKIGSLVKNDGSWDFHKANGEIFRGTSAEPLGETLEEASWRDGSIRFVIYAIDNIPDECLPGNEEDYAYTVTKLLNSNAYLINLGTNANKASLDKLLKEIQEANGTEKGTFFNNKPLTTAMNNAADYIIGIAKKLSKPVDWVLVNTEILWNTEYNDLEHDPPLNLGEHSTLNTDRTQPQDLYDETLVSTWGLTLSKDNLYEGDKLLAEKWRYRHFNNYFDNSPTQVSWHARWMPDPVSVFEYPGKYRVNYKRRDNPLYPSADLSDPFDSYRYWSTDYDYAT